ncbi:serine/threonine protein kinase [Kineothrix sp. MSJ-39]|uniref:serine/threonine-protein kinase n=1 Tax=Kineothrix sp. MSJ-39 TaxID=2841533 RepID=UPI001C11CC9C|nr:serine/threonine-protein kinase [Kineothrix sp. MSJ-39]MBU5429006.1 serine/threonine protein kinase [Kineothrix sp. MSJ-39]
MDLSHRLAVSYYKTIATINEPHHIYLVQHIETQKLYIKKILDVYNIAVYEYLYKNPVMGIPRIIEYLEEDNRLILIEEYISGCSLQDKIDEGKLSLTDIFCYMPELCDILESLHAHSPAIIHRDIKPSNIIITNYNKAVLLDFNAAKYYSEQEKDTVLLGTQGYAAPEQYGFGASSPQTDIYSLGILLKEMTASVNYSDKRIQTIIQKCTQVDPSGRYQDVRELRNELSHLSKLPSETGLSATASSGFQKYALPGFRTKTPWKMFLSFLCYLFLTWLCLTLEIKNTYGAHLWVERIYVFAIFLSIIFCSFNYLDVQRFLPFCRSRNKVVHYLGILLLNIAVIFCLLLMLCITESIWFST